MIATAASAGFHQLYPEGRGFPEPSLVTDGRLAVDRNADLGITPVTELFAGSRYGNPFSASIFVAPDAFTSSLHPLYANLANPNAPPSIVATIDDCRTIGSVILASGKDGVIVYETWRPNDRAAMAPDAGRVTSPFVPPDHDLDDAEVLFVSSAGSSNYGHFLVDDLPRIAALKIMRWHRPGKRMVVAMVGYGDPIDRVRVAAVRALDSQVEILLLDPTTAYRFDRLWYASPVSCHPSVKNPAALADLCKKVGRLDADPRAFGGERVYVMRAPGADRNLVNQEAVLRLVASRGFAIISPEHHAFREQVALFRHARLIVGQMGAAMTNAMFANQDTTILHLSPCGWVEPFYWDLAEARRQRYRVLYGTTVPAQSGTADTRLPPHRRDFMIDTDLLTDILKTML